MLLAVLTGLWSSLSVFIPSFIISALIVNWYRQRIDSTSCRRRPPCIKSLPIIGSLPFMNSNPFHVHLTKMSTRLGDVFAFYSGNKYTVVINGAHAVKQAFQTKASQFADRSRFFVKGKYLNPDRKGIIHAQYNLAFRRRRQFYLSTLKQFGFGSQMMEECINVEVAEMIQRVKQVNGVEFDPEDIINRCVSNVIFSTVLGKRYDFDDPALVEFTDAQHRRMVTGVNNNIVDVCPLLRFVPYYRKNFLERFNSDFNAMKLIKQMVSDVENEVISKDRDCFVRRVVDYGNRTNSDGTYDSQETFFAVSDLFLAGNDTSVSSILYMMTLLANHVDIQERIRRQLDDVVPSSSGRLPSLTDAPHLPLVEAFILETLRHQTVVPLALPHATVCDTEIDGCFIPADTMVLANLHSSNVDLRKWRDPDEFRLDRFIDDNGKIIGREKVVSFGLGKRSCIGEPLARQVLFLFLTGVMQNFNICPPEGQDKIPYDTKTNVVTTQTPFKIRLVSRNGKVTF